MSAVRPSARGWWLTVLPVLAGALLATWGTDWLRRDRDRAEAGERAAAGAALEQAVHDAVAPLDRLLDEAGRRMATASADAPEEDDDPTGEKEAKRLTEAMQQALVAVPLAEAAILTLYDRHDAQDAVLGRATATKVELRKGVGNAGRLSTATVRLLATEGQETGWALPEPAWLWFEEDPEDRVRIVRAVVMRGFEMAVEDGKKDPTLMESAYLVTASRPFRAGVLEWSVRCEVADGALAANPPWRHGALWPSSDELRGDGHWGEELVLDPVRSGWRFPAPTTLARGEVVVRYRWHPLRLLPWVPVAIGALLLLGFVGAWRRRRAPPPVGEPSYFPAEAAHEMRTPLTAMRGALEVALRRERSPAEYRETLNLCLDEVRGLENLHDAVLFLARGTRAEPAREPVDLRALAEAEVARLAAAHAERAVTLAAGPEPAVVTGDPSLLARLLGNLLDNAALHSVPGGAVRVRVVREGRQVVVTVEDDGPGVPAARRERIFERFYRGPEASRRGVPGSGLGLPIARWVAHLHGGTLTLDPEPSDRARFRLTLPAA